MDINKETRDRIFAAADELYRQIDRESFPTVDAVRKMAKVNMNDASAGMKEWRRAQTAQAAPVAVQVPEVVQLAGNAALGALWHQAQELANESLRAAQLGWDAERDESNTLNKQMADAYEVQASELEAAQRKIMELDTIGRQAAEDIEVKRLQIEETSAALLGMQQRAVVGEQRAEEIERRATDLRTELNHAHQEATQARAELTGVRKAHDIEINALRAELVALQAKAENVAEKSIATIDALRSELATVKAKFEAAQEANQEHRKQAFIDTNNAADRLTVIQGERDQALKDVGQAREDAASLRGQIEAIKQQNYELLQTLKKPTIKQGQTPKKS